MSELAPDPVSLVERLHSFFHVELAGDSELAGQYDLDPAGTLAEHFTDLTPADLDDAMRLASENTTASYTEFGGDSAAQLDGESPFAFAFRANYEAAGAGAEVEPGPDGGAAFDPLAAMDGGLDFGSGLSSYADADPTFDGSDGGEVPGQDIAGQDVGSLPEPAPATNDTGDTGGSWDGGLHEDPALDADDGQFDTGLDG